MQKSSSDKYENDFNQKYELDISGDISVKHNIDESDQTVTLSKRGSKKKKRPPRMRQKISNKKIMLNESDLDHKINCLRVVSPIP